MKGYAHVKSRKKDTFLYRPTWRSTLAEYEAPQLFPGKLEDEFIGWALIMLQCREEELAVMF
jgi:hypothetical protein